MRTAILIASLAFLACEKKQGKSPVGGVPAVAEMRLPKVEGAQPIDEQARVIVDLTEHGEVRLEGRPVSLDELGAKLSESKRMLHLTRKAKGRSGYVKVKGGGTGSAMCVLLRADRRAVWEHVCTVLTVCAEEKIFRVQFAVEGGKIDAFLPVDRGIQPIPQDPVNEIMVAVELLGRGERPVGWGPTGKRETVKKPTQVVYRYGGRKASRDNAAKFAKDALKVVKATENAVVVGQVRATAKMEFGFVVDMLALLRANGLKDIQFVAITIPTRATRARATLPYPKGNNLLRAWGDRLEDLDPMEEEVEEEDGG